MEIIKHLENISGDQLWQLMACLASPWEERMKDECSTEIIFFSLAEGTEKRHKFSVAKP